MRTRWVFVLLTIVALAGYARGSDDSLTTKKRREPAISAAKFATAVAIGSVTYMPGVFAGMLVAPTAHFGDLEDTTIFPYVVVGGEAFYAAGCAFGPWIVGSGLLGENGRLTSALAGSAIGAAVATPLVFLLIPHAPELLTYTLGYGALVVLPPLGAVIGYNLSRHSKSAASPTGYQLLPPAVALGMERLPTGRNSPTFHARLLNVLF